MKTARFTEQEAKHLTLHGATLGWCQFEGEQPEHGYLVVTRLSDGCLSALDRRSWQTARALCATVPTRLQDA